MQVSDLIALLSAFPDDLEVTVTDGYQGKTYSGAFEVKLFNEGNGKFAVDIGVGGLEVYD